jgi:hypothetical protein
MYLHHRDIHSVRIFNVTLILPPSLNVPLLFPLDALFFPYSTAYPFRYSTSYFLTCPTSYSLPFSLFYLIFSLLEVFSNSGHSRIGFAV